MDLTNVYAFLLDKYGEQLTILYGMPPSYLSNIIGPDGIAKDQKLIFISEQHSDTATSPTIISPSKLNIKTAYMTDLNLTGSPLKDDCDVDANISIELKILPRTTWKPEEEFHYGIDFQKALNIISDEAFQNQQISELKGSVWILSNGKVHDKTIFLQYEFDSEYFSRGIIHFTGLKDTAVLHTTQPLLDKHFSCIRRGTQLETLVENVYKIKEDILIYCTWTTTVPVPVLTDLKSGDVILSQVFRLKECGPLTQDLINQLRILMCIRDDIISFKELGELNSGKEPLYRCGCGIDIEDLGENINQILTEISAYSNADSGCEIECDIENVVQKAKLRKLTDLTDKLWDYLKRCSSYKELKTAFQILFQSAARCNILNIPTNKNRLAEIIAEVSNRRLAIPCLTGTEPLELLLEIGLEKLYKDYEFIFTESKICSTNNLRQMNTLDEDNVENASALQNVRKSLHNAVKKEPITQRKTLLHKIGSNMRSQENNVGLQNSNFDAVATGTQLSRLLQIHCILEHLLMLQVNFNLQSVYGDICEELLRRPLKRFENIDESFSDQMDISISIHNIREHLEGRDPYSRRITFKSKNKFRQVKTIFYFSLKNVFPPQIFECSADQEVKDIRKENMYHSWIYQNIKSLK